MSNQEYVSVREAAHELGFKSICHARKVMGKPDAKVRGKNQSFRYLYTPYHVEAVKEKIRIERIEKNLFKGKRSCYQCRLKYSPEELKSGICLNCQAKKCVLNFACNGDCTKCYPSHKRLNALRKEVAEMEKKIGLYYC